MERMTFSDCFGVVWWWARKLFCDFSPYSLNSASPQTTVHSCSCRATHDVYIKGNNVKTKGWKLVSRLWDIKCDQYYKFSGPFGDQTSHVLHVTQHNHYNHNHTDYILVTFTTSNRKMYIKYMAFVSNNNLPRVQLNVFIHTTCGMNLGPYLLLQAAAEDVDTWLKWQPVTSHLTEPGLFNRRPDGSSGFRIELTAHGHCFCLLPNMRNIQRSISFSRKVELSDLRELVNRGLNIMISGDP